MKKACAKPDYLLLGDIIVLLGLGILIMASVSASLSLERFGNTYYFLKHQILFGIIPGIFLGFIFYKINLSLLKKWSLLLILLNLALMVLVFFPVIGSASSEFTAARWIGLGPFSFQPSEFLKITFILYLASWLCGRTGEKMQKDLKKIFGAFLIIMVVIALLLILQPDISTLVVISACALLMYFLADTPLWHIITAVSLGFLSLLFLIKMAPYRVKRLLVFLNQDIDPMGMGYQLKQALIAVGSGGLFGLGLGMSKQKLGFLPQSISDSIFAIFAEEAGFLGALFLVFLFLFFLWRIFKIVKINQDKFLQLTAVGISCWIVLQGFINLGAMIGILPLTGIPLPFISYGGSHMVAELIGVGILLNISKS